MLLASFRGDSALVKKTAAAPLSVWRPINLDTFLLGAPHYPEHVD
jgi:beta-galactosidase